MRKLICLLAGLFAAGIAQAEVPKDLPREVVIKGVEFVLVPEGWFHYSVQNRDPKTGYPRGRPRREVKAWVDTFYIGKYEARARDFMRFMNEAKPQHAGEYGTMPGRVEWGDGENVGCSVRKDGNDAYYLVSPESDLPATHLSWNLANEFAAALGFRLPTDAEWVRAFRGDDKRSYPWGDEYPDDTYAGFQEGGTSCDVRPVTAYPKGRSPYGVYNMSGNVYEYVADWFNIEHMANLKDGARNPFAAEPFLSPDIDKPHRMLRGGRWASGPGQLTIQGSMDIQLPDEGFRCFGTRFAVDAATVRDLLARGEAKAAP